MSDIKKQVANSTTETVAHYWDSQHYSLPWYSLPWDSHL